MARIHTVKKSRKDQGVCSGCKKPLPKGSSYRWIAFRFGGRFVKCMECSFKRSELTQSKMSAVYAAVESAEEWVMGEWDGDVEELRTQLDECGDAIEEIAEEYQDGADNIRDHFPDSEKADEMEQRADELREFADSVRSAIDDLREREEGEDPDEVLDDNRANVQNALDNLPE